jgi:hypothetical protein
MRFASYIMLTFLSIDYSHVDYNIFIKKITHTGTI